MNDREHLFTRRNFLKGAAVAALATSTGISIARSGAAPEARAAEEKKSATVVLVRNREVFDKTHTLSSKVLGEMLDSAVKKLLSAKNAGEAWKKLVKPEDVVGIKTNVWASLPTPKELEELIKKRVTGAGVKEKKITVDDRGARVSLVGATALINVRPLRAHHWAGIGGCIKNYIMFADTPSHYHPNSCEPLGSLWKLPAVKGKTRINILVMLTPQFYGRGPHSFDARYVWDYCGIAVSTDPVAVDAIGAHLLRQKRLQYFGEEKPLTPSTHIEAADTIHHIGVSSLKNINLVKLGWKEEILI